MDRDLSFHDKLEDTISLMWLKSQTTSAIYILQLCTEILFITRPFSYFVLSTRRMNTDSKSGGLKNSTRLGLHLKDGFGFFGAGGQDNLSGILASFCLGVISNLFPSSSSSSSASFGGGLIFIGLREVGSGIPAIVHIAPSSATSNSCFSWNRIWISRAQQLPRLEKNPTILFKELERLLQYPVFSATKEEDRN